MEAIALLRKHPISERKAQLVVDLIRGLRVEQAFGVLKYTPKQAAPAISKLLKSAVANWHRLKDRPSGTLYVKTAYVGGAGMLKRIRPAAKGHAHRIRRRSCHITIAVGAMHMQAEQKRKMTKHHG